jgi:hypothetical protein
MDGTGEGDEVRDVAIRLMDVGSTGDGTPAPRSRRCRGRSFSQLEFETTAGAESGGRGEVGDAAPELPLERAAVESHRNRAVAAFDEHRGVGE